VGPRGRRTSLHSALRGIFALARPWEAMDPHSAKAIGGSVGKERPCVQIGAATTAPVDGLSSSRTGQTAAAGGVGTSVGNPRCVRIFRITTGSSMVALERLPRQVSYADRLNAKGRFEGTETLFRGGAALRRRRGVLQKNQKPEHPAWTPTCCS
jgi:hypothetical protein